MSQVLAFIRHAQADVKPGRLAGWTPGIHLSEEGRRQAADLAERLTGVRLTALYSSPLERCMETAQAIAQGRRGLKIEVEEAIGEVRYGSWQGQKLQTLARKPLWRTVQLVPSQASFPGGESIRDLQHRAVEAVESIRARHRRGVIAVVSHADTIKVLAAHYLGMHLDLYQRISIANASVTAVHFGMVPRVLCLSDTGNYRDLRPPPAPRKDTRDGRK